MVGVHATYHLRSMHEVEVMAFIRSWDYKETSNKAAEYGEITNPGASLQYNLHLSKGSMKHIFNWLRQRNPEHRHIQAGRVLPIQPGKSVLTKPILKLPTYLLTRSFHNRVPGSLESIQ